MMNLNIAELVLIVLFAVAVAGAFATVVGSVVEEYKRIRRENREYHSTMRKINTKRSLDDIISVGDSLYLKDKEYIIIVIDNGNVELMSLDGNKFVTVSIDDIV